MKFQILLLFLPFASFGQLGEIHYNNFKPVGSINRTGGTVPNASLEMSIVEADTMFVLRFEDATFQSPVFGSSQPLRETVYFKGINNTIEKLYDILKNVFIDKRYEEEEYETTCILGTRTVVIRRDFYSDRTKIQFITDGRILLIKNLKELDRLFGK